MESPDSPSQSASDDTVVARLLEEFAQKIEAGQPVDPEAYGEKYPEHAEELREAVHALEALGELGLAAAKTSSSPRSSVDDPRTSGRTLGDFRILREVACGGMGVVYEAEQVSLGRRVALKVLPFAGLFRGQQLERFKNEARAAASLHHSNIVPVYSVGCDRGVHFYAMQYIDGQTLADLVRQLREIDRAQARGEGDNSCNLSKVTRQWLARQTVSCRSGRAHRSDPDPPTNSTETNGQPAPDAAGNVDQPMPESLPAPAGLEAADTQPIGSLPTERPASCPAYFRTIAELGIQVANALDYAHEQGIVHRDIKPSNLLLDESGRVWVTDFGLARLQSDASLTMSGDLLGTLRYMSPEQALAKRAVVDHRTDIYSLGATLYEILALEPAFPSDDRHELLQCITSEDPRPLRRSNGAVPAELETIVLKAMRRAPAERYETAQALADDLARYLDHKPILASPPTLVERTTKWMLRHKPLVFSAALSLLVAFAAAALSFVLVSQSETRRLREVAEAEHRRAVQHELTYRQSLYATDISLAYKAYQAANIPRMKDLLRRHQPASGERDLRSFAWYHLWHRGQIADRCLKDRLHAHEQQIYHAEFSADGRLLATASQDGTAKLWDVATRQLLATFTGHKGEVNYVSFSPDGQLLATAGDDGTVRLWDRATGHQLRMIQAHGGLPSKDSEALADQVTFSPDGKLLASSSHEETKLWDVRTGKPVGRFPGSAARFSPANDQLATATRSGELALWDIKTRKKQAKRVAEASRFPRLFCIQFSRDGKTLFAVDRGGHVIHWDLNTDSVVRTYAHDGQVDWCAVSADDSMLATASYYGSIKLWDLPTNRMRTVPFHHGSRAWCVAFAPDGQTLATTGSDGDVRFWKTGAVPFPRVIEIEGISSSSRPVCALGRSADGKTWAVVAGKRVTIWDDTFQRPISSFPAPIDEPTSLSLSATGRWLAVSNGEYAAVWDVRREEQVWTRSFSGPTPWTYLHLLAFAPDESMLAIVCDDRTILVDPLTGKDIVRLVPPTCRNMQCSTTFSPDGRLLAIGDDHGDVFVYDIDASSWAEPFHTYYNEVYCLAFAPDSKTLAVASRDNMLTIWDLSSDRERFTLSSHVNCVTAVAFSADGKSFASASLDGTVKLWSLATGRELYTLVGDEPGTALWDLDFSPNGKTLVACGLNAGHPGQLFVWSAGTDGTEDNGSESTRRRSAMD